VWLGIVFSDYFSFQGYPIVGFRIDHNAVSSFSLGSVHGCVGTLYYRFRSVVHILLSNPKATCHGTYLWKTVLFNTGSDFLYRNWFLGHKFKLCHSTLWARDR
jgi:hypothetical protein